MASTSNPSPSLEWSVARAGASAWVELRLFEVVGGWITTTPEPGVKAVLATLSRHHAWRGGLWRDLLPVTADHDPAGLTRPPNSTTEGLLDRLAGTEGTTARLGALRGEVLPEIAGSYTEHLGWLGPVADEPVRRVLHLVIADLDADRAALAGVSGGPAPVETASGSSGLLGPPPPGPPWPERAKGAS